MRTIVTANIDVNLLNKQIIALSIAITEVSDIQTMEALSSILNLLEFLSDTIEDQQIK